MTLSAAKLVTSDVTASMHAMGRAARLAARDVALASDVTKNAALQHAAAALRARASDILEANARDLDAARQRGVASAFLTRLTLDAKRIEAIAKGLEEIVALPDPVGDKMQSGHARMA